MQTELLPTKKDYEAKGLSKIRMSMNHWKMLKIRSIWLCNKLIQKIILSTYGKDNLLKQSDKLTMKLLIYFNAV